MPTIFHADALSAHLVDKGVDQGVIDVVRRGHSPRRDRCVSSMQTMWVPLPHHPSWTKSITRTLKALRDDDSALMRLANFVPLNFKPAWSNSIPNLAMNIIAKVGWRKGLGKVEVVC